MIRKLIIIFLDFQRQMNKKNISAYSASTAFFIFLSLMPMLILLCTILPFTPVTEGNLVNAAKEIVPSGATSFVEGIISDVYDKSAGVMSVAIIAILWSAGKGVLALIRGLNAINGVEEKRTYIVLRVIASFYTLVMIIVTVLSLLVMVFGNVLKDLLLSNIPEIQVLMTMLMHLRFLAVWAVLTLIFSGIYAYVPDKKLKFRDQIPGASFSAVVWSVFSWGFSMYIERTNAFSTYGSLSIIVIIMLWLYFCMYIMLIGAYINRYLEPAYRVLGKNS